MPGPEAAALLQDREEDNCDSRAAARVGLLPGSAPTFRHDPHSNWRLVAACRAPEMPAGRRVAEGKTSRDA